MRTLFAVVLSTAIPAAAQEGSTVFQRGEELFSTSCGSPYCHGVKGTGGGAPRLAARGFDQAYISNTVSRGLPGTSMAGFGSALSRADLNAVIAYVAGLNGITNPSANVPLEQPAQRTLSEAARRGGDLFSEATRGFGRCSTCHEVNGIGIPVTVPISTIPKDVALLRALATPAVRTAILGAQTMPALTISNGHTASIFYDLTSTPPVLHTAEPGGVNWREGSNWRHSSVIGAYTDEELSSILEYLREAVH